MELRIRVDLNHLRSWYHKTVRGLNLDILANILGPAAVREFQEIVPYRTGELSNSFNWRLERSGTNTDRIHVYSNLPYAKYLDKGTRPHKIVAHGRALVLPGDILRKSAMHPGIPAGHYSTKVCEKMNVIMKKEAKQFLLEAMR